MRYPNTKNTTAIFAAFIPLLIITLFFITQGESTTNNMDGNQETVQNQSMNWAFDADNVVFTSSEMSRLARELHEESEGYQRAAVLDSLLLQITARLTTNEQPVPMALTDLLRDVSVAHPESETRLFAYTAMMKALENEELSYETHEEFASN
ncbi:hypothetical protein [Natronogracilivirga saccharolytica]|uniref:Uncharacterized protein n=1 Tax=Natronogracilivirga saccharolytica TaxID=2812953 RepID=A0A8J7RKW6_9BACT|nr:hypothetical protein [Natronogracilivirga saccharolytica]MBP3192705.1 hypothetical protein [Natronogracilivirga saccharolytica]